MTDEELPRSTGESQCSNTMRSTVVLQELQNMLADNVSRTAANSDTTSRIRALDPDPLEDDQPLHFADIRNSGPRLLDEAARSADGDVAPWIVVTVFRAP